VALHRRRRIFRSAALAPRRNGGRNVGRTVLAGVLGTVVAGAALMLVLPAQLFGRVPAMTGMLDAPIADVAVVDGHTLRVGDAVVRLQGVDAPSRGTTCLQADNSRFDCGAAATEALSRLVRGRSIACRLYGRDAEGFLQGLCEAGGQDINRGIVAAGWARARSEMPGFAEASFTAEESEARAAHRGLWQGGATSF